MSWLEHSEPKDSWRDALADEIAELRAEENMQFQKVIASREKSIKMLDDRIKEYERMCDGRSEFEKKSIKALIDVDVARRERLKTELEVFKGMSADPRQIAVPGTEKKGR